MSKVERFDSFQRRHGWLSFPLAVVYKYADDQGAYLAALITYYGFLSLFPLLLLLVTVLGFTVHGNAALQQQVVGSALQQFPVIGPQIRHNVTALNGNGAGLGVGIVGTLYGGLGVAQAAQNALNRVWSIPRNERPNPIKSRLRSLLILLVLGAGVLVTTGLSALGASASGFSANFGSGVRIVVLLLSVVANIGLFIVGFRLLTARDVTIREVVVGAGCAGVAWQVLQGLGALYVTHELRGSTDVYGTFGLVLGLIAWIYLEAVIIVLCAEINVVRARHLWPRALLTPFTDAVDLTRADRRAYTAYAGAERYKGFEEVDVSFRPTDATPAGQPDPTPDAGQQQRE